GEKIDLTATSSFNSSHVMFEHLDPWMDKVEEDTDGQVNFEVFTSEELVDSGKEYDGLEDGISDVAISMLPTYDPKRFPLTEVTLLPLTESSTETAMNAFVKLMDSDEEIKDGKSYYELEFEDNGLKAL